MEAIVMAAGEGRRLRPVTDRWAKPVLPIDGRPVLASLLRELAAAGLRRTTVVSGHLAEQVEALAGDGSAWGLELRLARQPRADGSADAVRCALRAGARLPAVVVGSDTLFSPGDVGRFAAAARDADGAVAVRRDPPPSPPHRSAVRLEHGRVVRVLDDDPANGLAGAPLWLFGARFEAAFEALAGEPPLELARLLQDAVDEGARIVGVEIGKTRDLTGPADLARENFPYLEAL